MSNFKLKELTNKYPPCSGLAPPALHGGPLLRLHHAPPLLLRLAQRVVGGRQQRGRGRGRQRLQVRVRGAAGLLDPATLRRVQLIQASAACITFT